jgi:hypothetical protein
VSTAEDYLQHQDGGPPGWRIDLISVQLGRDYRVLRVDHLKSAVEE